MQGSPYSTKITKKKKEKRMEEITLHKFKDDMESERMTCPRNVGIKVACEKKT